MKRHLIAAKSILLFLILTLCFVTAANADTAVENVKVGIVFWPGLDTAFYGRINPDSKEVEGYYVDLLVGFNYGPDGYAFADGVYMPLMCTRKVYLTNDPDAPLVLHMADMAGRKAAVAPGLEQLQYVVEENSVDIELIDIAPEEQSLVVDAVINGEYDAFVPVNFLNKYQYDLSKLGISSISEVDWNFGVTGAGSWIYLTDKEELAEHLSETLYSMMKEGALTELSKSYFRVDVSQPTDDPELVEKLWQDYEP